MPKTIPRTTPATCFVQSRASTLSTAIDAIRVARTLIEEGTATYAGGRRFDKVAQSHIAELRKEARWITEWLEGAEQDFDR